MMIRRIIASNGSNSHHHRPSQPFSRIVAYISSSSAASRATAASGQNSRALRQRQRVFQDHGVQSMLTNSKLLRKHPKPHRRRKPKGMYVVESMENETLKEPMHRRDPSDFDYFRAGDRIAVRMYAQEVGKPKYKIVSGVCLGRRNGGIRSTFYLRVYAQGSTVEYIIPYHSPWVVQIKVVEKWHRKRWRAKMFELRKNDPEFFKVDIARGFLKDAIDMSEDVRDGVDDDGSGGNSNPDKDA